MSVVVDGHTYENESLAPDLKSIACVDAVGNIREYRCLSADVSLLPKYDDLATGSSCLVQDTSEYYEYNAYSKQWYKM